MTLLMHSATRVYEEAPSDVDKLARQIMKILNRRRLTQRITQKELKELRGKYGDNVPIAVSSLIDSHQCHWNEERQWLVKGLQR